MSALTVICPNSRRCIVKVSPSTQLHKVLEEASLKQGYDVDMYELRHQNRPVDLAISFRLSGLPNNATLEMAPVVRSGPANVEIALQIGDGSRKMLRLSNDRTLSEVLIEFSKEFGRDLMSSSGNKVPCCAYLNKEYRGSTELSATKLKDLGISGGRTLIRYSMSELSDEELKLAEHLIHEENERKKKLLAGFEARKAENERREQLEIRREKMFEREILEKQQYLKSEKHFDEQNTATATMSSREPLSTLETQKSLFSKKIKEEQSSISTTNDNSSFFAQSSQPASSNNMAVLDSSIKTAVDVTTENTVVTQPTQSCASAKLSVSSTASTAKSNDDREAELLTDLENLNATCDRSAVIFVREEEERKASNIGENAGAEDDHFFELNVNDARIIQRDLRDDIRRQVRRALYSQDFIDRLNKKLKEEAYKHTVVRFVLSNRNVIQAQFLSLESVSHLYDFITECLNEKTIKYELHFAINQKISNDRKVNLVELGVAPSSNVYVKFRSSVKDIDSLFKKDKLRNVNAEEATNLSREWLSFNGVFRPYEPELRGENDDAEKVAYLPTGHQVSYGRRPLESGASPSPDTAQPSGPVPKWFKKH